MSGVFAALLCTVLFSLSVACGHRSARLIGGTEANFWRLALATVFLGIWAYGFGVGLRGEAFPVFLASGMLGIGVGDVALFQTLPRLGSRLSLLLSNCFTAPLAAVLEWLWLGTALTARQMLCALVILIGVGIALTPGKDVKHTRRELVVGTVWAVISALGGAWGAVLSRRAYQIAHEGDVAIDGANAAFQRILGGLLIAGVCLLIVKRHVVWRLLDGAVRRSAPAVASPAPAPGDAVGGREALAVLDSDWWELEVAGQKWLRLWPWVLINSVAGQTLGVSCMQWALERTPTGIVLSVIAMTPIVVIPFARVLEHERPTILSLIGGAVAVVGVVALVAAR